MQNLKDNPFRPSENTNAGLLNSSEFLTASDFENVQAKLNYNEKLQIFQVKLILSQLKIYFSVGGSVYYRTRNNDRYPTDIPSYAFNWENNRQINEYTYRGFKLTQFGNQESNSEEMLNN